MHLCCKTFEPMKELANNTDMKEDKWLERGFAKGLLILLFLGSHSTAAF
jgi:hypothetical protein